MENVYFKLTKDTVNTIINIVYFPFKEQLSTNTKKIIEEVLIPNRYDNLFCGLSNRKLNICTLSDIYEMDCDCRIINLPTEITKYIAEILKFLTYAE